MDLTQIKEFAIMAAVLLGTFSPAAAALMQLVKQAYGKLSGGQKLSADLQAVLPGIIAGGMVAWTLMSQGAPWLLAAVATLVALYLPKAFYDTAKAAHNAAANTAPEEPK
jgi:divalent metal cation (Fe/Co/Zn/Cd) transporter